MTKAKHAAIIDVGKTNAKITLAEVETAAELAHRSIGSRVIEDGPYPHLDVARLWDFLCDALADLNRETRIDAISITAHAAAGAFIDGDSDGDGLTLPALDYEYLALDDEADAYDAVRPDFSETFSPRLPGGLNLGAQIFWQERHFPDAVKKASAYVTYAQYWAWRLSGVAATEMCSLGAHTDLWNARTRTWSSLVERMRWGELLAPLRSAFDVLGPVRPALAGRLGLKPDVPVICGIHDSSASLLTHVLAERQPFTVVSTGTWTIVFAAGGDLDRLDPERDTLANNTPFGDPVPCARFMGGREFEKLVGATPQEPTDTELNRIIDERIMPLPTFVANIGPFPKSEGRWTHDPESLTPGERTAAASLYLGLMTAESMTCIGADGPTIVEGPLATNSAYGPALTALTGRDVRPSTGTGGTTLGALCLVDRDRQSPPSRQPFPALTHPRFAEYAQAWREQAGH